MGEDEYKSHESMSETRPPLLSDYDLEHEDGHGNPLMGSWDVRDHYERLIDEGKLRAVEEVEDIGGYFDDFICSKCGYGKERGYVCSPVFCPGCGNPVKR